MEVTDRDHGAMPGMAAYMPLGQVCDEHAGRRATHRVCVKADEFGAEFADLCPECHDEHRGTSTSECDWCGKDSLTTNMRGTRDIDESSNGPVYTVCPKCFDILNDF